MIGRTHVFVGLVSAETEMLTFLQSLLTCKQVKANEVNVHFTTVIQCQRDPRCFSAHQVRWHLQMETTPTPVPEWNLFTHVVLCCGGGEALFSTLVLEQAKFNIDGTHLIPFFQMFLSGNVCVERTSHKYRYVRKAQNSVFIFQYKISLFMTVICTHDFLG